MKKAIYSIFIILLVSIVSACSSTPELKKEIRVVEKNVYPDMRKFDYPEPPKLLPVKWDWPRTSVVIPKNTSKCLDVPKGKRDDEYWKKCGINKVDFDSNVFIGLKENYFQNLSINMERIEAYMKKYKKRIEAHNNMVDKYRKLEKEEQKRVEKVKEKGNDK